MSKLGNIAEPRGGGGSGSGGSGQLRGLRPNLWAWQEVIPGGLEVQCPLGQSKIVQSLDLESHSVLCMIRKSVTLQDGWIVVVEKIHLGFSMTSY
jgi:hypothetical protein